MHFRLLGFVLVAGAAGCGVGDSPLISGDVDASGSSDEPDARAVPRDGPAIADAMPSPDAEPPFPFASCASPDDPLPPLVEDRAYYLEDTLDVMEIELQISDLAGFAEVNDGIEGAEVSVVFTEGDYTATGSLRIRGGASRQNAQKNYKVELDDQFERWEHQREINLNKHMNDMTRVRNKMAFDLFQTVPDLTSLRTRFAHVTVNGASFGLYTWIEEPDRKFLKFHGLDPDGALYKANYFYFQPIAAAVAAIPAMLELFIDPKENPDNAKLLRMLDALHADDLDVDAFFAAYFERDNLITWLATNILLNDVDTLTQNFYLYSPSSCEGWYLLPWDYDGAWGFYAQYHPDTRERWQSGLTNWWVSDLWAQFFTRPANVAAVEAKLLELSQTVLTDQVTAAKLTSYDGIVQAYISTTPDLQHFPAGNDSASVALAKWQTEWTRITTTTSRFFAEYHDVIERPMPVALDFDHEVPLEFGWDWSYDLQGDPLTYDLQVAHTAEFSTDELVLDIQDVSQDEWNVADLPPGAYFWRVVVEDHMDPDSWQLPYYPYAEFVIPPSP